MSRNNFEPLQIFISYHPSDKDFALNLANALEEKKLKVWAKDVHASPGKRLDRQLEEALEESKIVLFILSQESVESREILAEAYESMMDRKTFIPLQIEPCELPKKLGRIQYIDLHTNRAKGIENLFKVLAMKGYGFSGLHSDIVALLTEGEQSLLKKKEMARKKVADEKLKKRKQRNVLIVVANVLVGILAFITWQYYQRDINHFDNFSKEYEIETRYKLDSIEIIEKKFLEHQNEYIYCIHSSKFNRIKINQGYDSWRDKEDLNKEYRDEIVRLKSIVDSLQQDQNERIE